jgi:hypothetical protein
VEGNIIKYITRWRQKGGVQDIEKVIHYAQILLEEERKKEPQLSLFPEFSVVSVPKWMIDKAADDDNGKHF